MEVEDRHLNVMIDLINGLMEGKCERLLYLSEQFSPSDLVYRLSQMIVYYEKSISSDSVIAEALELDPNADSYCLNASSLIKLWLLEYYKHDFVTINEIKLENGDEEEVVLTSLMVLRVLYRMRQMMDKRANEMLTKGWKDLQEFDQQLDEKFETKCLNFMTLLVKHSKNYNSKMNSLNKRINGLEEENKKLREELKRNDQKVGSNPNRLNRSPLKKVSNIEDKSDSTVKERPIESPPEVTASAVKPSNSSTIKVTSIDPKYLMRSPNRTIIIKKSPSTTTPLVEQSLQSSPQRKPLSPNVKQTTTSITRRSPRISKSEPKPNESEQSIQSLPNNTLQEIRDIFNESDESEFDFFENTTSKHSMPEPIALPLKKRKTTLSQSPEKSPNNSTTHKKTLQNSKKQTKLWPSRNKSYPRKKRYPCSWTNCDYVADRPSTLVRHSRAHTGEKPYACDWPGCSKRYKMSSNLTPHKLTHTGEKPYRCDWPHCYKKFTYPQHLKRHRIAHQKRCRLQRTLESTKTVIDVNKRLKQELIAITSA